MDTNKSYKKKPRKVNEEGKETMTRFDLYIIFLFFVQIYIFFTNSLANNYNIPGLIASKAALANVVFVLYCVTYLILFINSFNLVLGYKQKLEQAKNSYILLAFIGTIVLMVVKFAVEILILQLKQPMLVP